MKSTRLIVGLAMTLAGWLAPGFAHWADVAVSEATIGEREVQITLTLPTGLVAFADLDKSGRLSADEVADKRADLEAFLADKIRLSSGGLAGALRVSALELDQVPARPNIAKATHSTLQLRYRWSRALSDLKIRYDLFIPEAPKASNLMTVFYQGKVENTVFTPENREFRLGGKPTQTPNFISLGIHHILSGWDHLLFVIALVALGGGLGYLLKVITAFTLAHSITLISAALGFIELPSRLIESMIALSIAYVAAENIFYRNKQRLMRRRWIAAFGFGLFHGLGFAGILAEMALPKENLILSLLGFNLGVELGQLMVVIPAFVMLTALRRWSWEVRVRYAISLTAVAAGLYWFVQRAFFPA